MSMVSRMQDLIIQSYLYGDITESEMDYLIYELPSEYDYYTEDGKEKMQKIKTVIKHPTSKESKEILKSAADAYNSGMNKRADFVAKKIVKDPSRKGVKVSSEVYEKYKKDILKWKTIYKVSEIAVTGLVAVGPIDTVVKAATVTAMTRSNDPVDKATMELLNKMKQKASDLKDKAKDFVRNVKNKVLSKDQIQKGMNQLEIAGAALAKQTDTVKKKLSTKSNTITESTFMMLDDIILENSTFTEKSYSILLEFVEKADFSNPSVFDIIMNYCEV